MYFVKAPWVLQKIYSDCIWSIPTKEKIIYLTFDDGPHAVATDFVLNTLKAHSAKASFFCIGKNVLAYPTLYKTILDEGHRMGNHSFSHLNGWKTSDAEYFDDIVEAKKYIDSKLFRPPYGRITKFQAKYLKQAGFKIIMWNVLSADFEVAISVKKCIDNVIKNANKGSLIVFHDSEKAFPLLKETLPTVLKYYSERGYRFEAIPL